jgi:hypothetical protein
MRKKLTTILSGIAMAALLGGVLAGASLPAPAEAATPDARNFDPGRIIDDGVFYNPGTMGPGDIQAFIDSKESCAPTAGNPGCLESYRSDTPYKPANANCSEFAAGSNEIASAIIFRAAQACGVNPQVILATLEKEQGLVTSNNPNAGKYRIAMGYGCPDTAACDTAYYGFGNQVIAAARQFKRYVAPGNTFRYKAGQVNVIQWHPNAACGASEVYIANNATAALYNYTPYRPNQAALNNLGGLGDGCSSYGNRNFWKFFTDWFGSTTVPKAASAFVRSLYNDVLGREAGAVEVHGWGMLVTNGRAPVEVAAGFVDSDEYRLIRIDAAYQTILGRGAETGGAWGWLVNMKNGLLTTDDVDKVFLATEEYLTNTGGTNESFVAALYQRLIGRAAAPEEVSGWAAIAAAQGRHVVVNSIWSSVETARSRVSLMYASYLGRAPEEAGVAGWAQIAIERGDAGVRWAIIGSAEYWGRASARFPNG